MPNSSAVRSYRDTLYGEVENVGNCIILLIKIDILWCSIFWTLMPIAHAWLSGPGFGYTTGNHSVVKQPICSYNAHIFSSGECLYFEENQGMWAYEVAICNCNYKIISTFESWITVMVWVNWKQVLWHQLNSRNLLQMFQLNAPLIIRGQKGQLEQSDEMSAKVFDFRLVSLIQFIPYLAISWHLSRIQRLPKYCYHNCKMVASYLCMPWFSASTWRGNVCKSVL